MKRKILACPTPPTLAETSDSHPGTMMQTFTIQVITPMFGGGVEPGVNDPVTLIRPSSIRGHLRFWWRATCGAKYDTVRALRQREGEIWGTTANPSPVDVNVSVPADNQSRFSNNNFGFDKYGPEAYALFPAKQNNNTLCREGVTFKLELCWLTHKDISRDIEAAVWAWVNFGGMGARTRRGCGALYCKEFAPPFSQPFSSWVEKKAEEYDFQLPNPNTHRSWPTFPTTICLKGGNKKEGDALVCWGEAIDLLKTFRQGRGVGRDPGGKTPGRSRWPEAESVRKIALVQRRLVRRDCNWRPEDRTMATPYFPRAEFGMPIILELRGEDLKPTLQYTKENDRMRMASPILLRPIRFVDGETASMIAQLNTEPLIEAYLKPEKNKSTPEYQISENEIRLTPPYPNVPHLASSGSALSAFIAFAKTKGFR